MPGLGIDWNGTAPMALGENGTEPLVFSAAIAVPPNRSPALVEILNGTSLGAFSRYCTLTPGPVFLAGGGVSLGAALATEHLHLSCGRPASVPQLSVPLHQPLPRSSLQSFVPMHVQEVKPHLYCRAEAPSAVVVGRTKTLEAKKQSVSAVTRLGLVIAVHSRARDHSAQRVHHAPFFHKRKMREQRGRCYAQPAYFSSPGCTFHCTDTLGPWCSYICRRCWWTACTTLSCRNRDSRMW